MGDTPSKSTSVFRTIGEVSDQFGIPRHVLRYWESRFPSLRPVQRAGNRRYYRAEDVDLIAKINTWLYQDGYTVKGVQAMLAGGSPGIAIPPRAAVSAPPSLVPALIKIRDRLARALAQDDIAARL
jgi:DNA-binding transcriptional MerR regulator